MEHFRNNIPFYVVLLLFCTTAFLWNAIFALGEGKDLTVYFLDIGQGDAIFIETPNGAQMLIDGGPNKKVLSELGDIMPFQDRSIDIVLLTHPHEDHVGGLIDVLERYDVGMIIDAGASYDSGAFRAWKDGMRDENAEYIRAERGMRVRLDANTWFDILLPETAIDVDQAHIHDSMVVGKLVHGDMCFIFTGDMERNVETKVLADTIDCDVLKVGHHGSKTSTSDAFLNAVSPAIAVISAGRENRFGHPHDVIVKKLLAEDISLFGTHEDGRIILFSDGEKIWKK